MPHVHFVLPDLGYTAAAKQVSAAAGKAKAARRGES